MKTYQDYKAVADKIDAVASSVGEYILYDDMNVNIENAGCDDNYELLISCAINAFGMRCDALGLNANDYGFSF
jgi:hypothetical protein